jgi:Tetratricopeptide repeat/Glycosyl transferase family 2
VWLAASLNLHEAVCATAGIDSPAESFTYYPLNRAIQGFTTIPTISDPNDGAKANPEWRTYGFTNPNRIEFVNFRSELRARGLDIPARDVSRLPWYVFDELEQMLSAAPYQVLGNIHGIWLSQMHQAYLAEPDILKGRSVVVMDLIRHPVGRTESAIRATMTFHLADLEPRIEQFIRAHARTCLKLERKYKIDFSEPRPRAALHVYRQGLQNDVWAYELREFPAAHRIFLERLQTDPDYYANVFSALSHGRLAADRQYLDRVFSSENLGAGRRSTSAIARPADTAEQYERWSPWEQVEFASVSRRLDSSRIYFPFGYDFAFMTPSTPRPLGRRSVATPRVSVFLSRRNHANVRRSVESVLAQTYQDFECVILDRAETGGRAERRPRFDDVRVSHRSAPDQTDDSGFWRTISHCGSDYVCACLTDEILQPGALEQAVAALDADPGVVAVTRDVELTRGDGRASGTVRGRPFELIAYMVGWFSPAVAGAVFRRSSIEAAGLATREWDPECRDFEFWCRLAVVGRILYLPGVSASSVHHPHVLGADAAHALRIARGREHVMKRIASDTTRFHGSPDLLRACLTGAALSCARHLLVLGAGHDAVDVCLSVADESGLLPAPRQPETPAAEYVGIAHGQRLDGREQLALDILATAMTLTSGDASVALEIGLTHAAAGRINRALDMYEAAIRIDPDCHDAHWERGVLLERRGQIDEALAAWRQSGLSRDVRHHSLYLAAALKSPRSTNENLLAAHQEWAINHTARRL